jgi:rhodanese-related sulfurtransferase
MMTTAVDQALTLARSKLERLSPHDAAAAAAMGAVLVDIRPEINRRIEGSIPGAITIERNVLEWRLDPGSPARIEQAALDAWVVLFCNEGYASSLAAVSLQHLGVWAATDLIGGYRGWRAAGLPTHPGIAAQRTARRAG